MHACHSGSCLTLSFFLGTATTSAQCLCHLLIAFSPHGRGMALCRRPEEEKEGQAANLELAGREKRQHLASLERRRGCVCGGGSCCSSMEAGTNKRIKWRGTEDESGPPVLAVLKFWESDTGLTENPLTAQLCGIGQGRCGTGGQDFLKGMLTSYTTENKQRKYASILSVS